MADVPKPEESSSIFSSGLSAVSGIADSAASAASAAAGAVTGDEKKSEGETSPPSATTVPINVPNSSKELDSPSMMDNALHVASSAGDSAADLASSAADTAAIAASQAAKAASVHLPPPLI